jgi:hypothetical protein
MIALVVGALLGLSLGPPRLCAQACKDEESMATEYKKDLADRVASVRKESLPDFEKAFHQKSTLTKLTLYGNIADTVMECLNKAAQDATTPKEEAETLKAKQATYAKLKEKIQHDREALKAAEVPKDAKDLIAKFDLAD